MHTSYGQVLEDSKKKNGCVSLTAVKNEKMALDVIDAFIDDLTYRANQISMIQLNEFENEYTTAEAFYKAFKELSEEIHSK